MYHYTTNGQYMEGAYNSNFSRFKGGESDESAADTTENYTPGESSPWTYGFFCAIALAIVFLIISIYGFYKTKYLVGILFLIMSILCVSTPLIYYYLTKKK